MEDIILRNFSSSETETVKTSVRTPFTSGDFLQHSCDFCARGICLCDTRACHANDNDDKDYHANDNDAHTGTVEHFPN